MITAPMLAATVSDDITKLRFPLLASPKLDGIRCLILTSPRTGNRIACSRKLKVIPNLHIRRTLVNSSLPLNIDGELIVGDNFQTTTSGVMSVDGQPAFTYYVFDYVPARLMSAQERYEQLTMVCMRNQLSWLKLVPQVLINNLAELDSYEQAQLAAGYEGIMLKAVSATYKCGRSTFPEHRLLKLKRFRDSEAKVIGFTELWHNENEQLRDNLGYAERSDAQEFLVPGNTLGALIVKDVVTHIEFKIGTGFSAKQRRIIWANKEQYLGRICTYKYQHHGVKIAPRCPVWLRWRDDYKL